MTKLICDICGKEIEPETSSTSLAIRKDPGYMPDHFDLCHACSNKLYTILTSKKVSL